MHRGRKRTGANRKRMGANRNIPERGGEERRGGKKNTSVILEKGLVRFGESEDKFGPKSL